MSRSHQKVQKREVLHRIRVLQESARKAQMMRANDDARQCFEEQARRGEALHKLDQENLDRAGEGVSMESFMRYQRMRDLHRFALDRAAHAHQDAVDTLDTERKALHSAVGNRRAAEKILETARYDLHIERSRREQRNLDDMTSARAVSGLGQ